MKKLLPIIFILCAFSVCAVNLQFNLGNFSSENLTNRRVLVTPLTLTNTPGSVPSYDAKYYTTTNSGYFWISNMVSGTYSFEIQAPPTVSKYRLYIPGGTSNVIADSRLMTTTNSTDSQSFAYTIAAVDALLAGLGGGSSSPTNRVGDLIVTNTAAITNLLIVQGPSSFSTNVAKISAGGRFQSNPGSSAGSNFVAGADNNWLGSGVAFSVIGGGQFNSNSAAWSVVGGGTSNYIGPDNVFSVIAGGSQNFLQSNLLAAGYATISGGGQNTNFATYGVIGGGFQNAITNTGGAAVIAGGYANLIGGSGGGTSGTIGGGSQNTISSGAGYQTIAGGGNNTVSGTYGTISGGLVNTASGLYSTVPGGSGNTASGDYSFAAGRNASAAHQGAFVLADSQASGVASTNADSLTLRFQGGVKFKANAELAVSNVFYGNASGASNNPPFVAAGTNIVVKTNGNTVPVYTISVSSNAFDTFGSATASTNNPSIPRTNDLLGSPFGSFISANLSAATNLNYANLVQSSNTYDATVGYFNVPYGLISNLPDALGNSVDMSVLTNSPYRVKQTQPLILTNGHGGFWLWSACDIIGFGTSSFFYLYTNASLIEGGTGSSNFWAVSQDLGTNGSLVAATTLLDGGGSSIYGDAVQFKTNTDYHPITFPTLADANGVSNTFMWIQETRGTLTPPIVMQNTNTVNSGGKHIAAVAGNATLTSSDGAFAGVVKGTQITFTSGQQVLLWRIIDNNTAMGYRLGVGTVNLPNVEASQTTWQYNPPVWTWTDNAVGSTLQSGGFMDNNGMFWFNALGDQGSTYYIDFSSGSASGSMMWAGLMVPGAFGLSSTNGEMLYAISAASTNSTLAARQAIWGVHSGAPSESDFVDKNGNKALSYDITNRHGAQNSFGLAISGKTNAIAGWPTAPIIGGAYAIVNSNATVYILTSTPNGAAWAATNKLAGP